MVTHPRPGDTGSGPPAEGQAGLAEVSLTQASRFQFSSEMTGYTKPLNGQLIYQCVNAMARHPCLQNTRVSSYHPTGVVFGSDWDSRDRVYGGSRGHGEIKLFHL